MSATGLAGPPVVAQRPRLREHRTALCNTLVGPVSLLALAGMVWVELHGPGPAFDFRFAYWGAGHRVLTGQSPYLWTAVQFRQSEAFVYPALSALVFAPMALFPTGFGVVVATLVCVALVPAILWIMRVRDWRVYGIALMWEPVYGAWMTANESLFLAFGLACLWRWRDRPAVAGLMVAVMISLKPLVWPLVLWLLVTRRWRASGHTLVCGVVLNLAAWSVIGFGQIGLYLRATGTDMTDAWRTGFGVPALVAHFGLDRQAGVAVMLLLSAGLVAAIVYSGFVKRDQIQALTLTVALALVSSPLLWSHYLVLLLVPLALLRPRLGWLWALPIVMWVCQPAAPAHTWQVVVDWITAGAMFAALARSAAPEPT
jgi:alpha-1,2-mannosyltransferase